MQRYAVTLCVFDGCLMFDVCLCVIERSLRDCAHLHLIEQTYCWNSARCVCVFLQAVCRRLADSTLTGRHIPLPSFPHPSSPISPPPLPPTLLPFCSFPCLVLPLLFSVPRGFFQMPGPEEAVRAAVSAQACDVLATQWQHM